MKQNTAVGHRGVLWRTRNDFTPFSKWCSTSSTILPILPTLLSCHSQWRATTYRHFTICFSFEVTPRLTSSLPSRPRPPQIFSVRLHLSLHVPSLRVGDSSRVQFVLNRRTYWISSDLSSIPSGTASTSTPTTTRRIFRYVHVLAYSLVAVLPVLR